MKEGICKFCGESKNLIKAHIIPKHFYLDYKKQKYRAINPEKGSYEIRQDGLKDRNNILCADCDGKILKQFDDEGYRVLLSEVYNHVFLKKNNDIIYHLEEKDFDYELLRKFFIAILWRASISPDKEFYNIDLGVYEKFAYEILKGVAEYEHLFKVSIFKAPKDSILNHSVYIHQIRNINKVTIYQIAMAGYKIYVFINSKKMSIYDYRQYNSFFMNKQSLYVLESKMIDNDNKDYLLNYFKRFMK